MKKARHPRQPVVLDERGVPRFKENKIVSFLLDEGPFDLNRLGLRDFTDEDRMQFEYFDHRTLAAADREVERLLASLKPANPVAE
jgi:hypothetical protein